MIGETNNRIEIKTLDGLKRREREDIAMVMDCGGCGRRHELPFLVAAAWDLRSDWAWSKAGSSNFPFVSENLRNLLSLILHKTFQIASNIVPVLVHPAKPRSKGYRVDIRKKMYKSHNISAIYPT